MAYYKVLIEVWCDWDPEDSDLEEIVRHVVLGEDSVCTRHEVVKVVHRPQDIENDQAQVAQHCLSGGDGLLQRLNTYFLFDPLRSDRRFAELVWKVGLPQCRLSIPAITCKFRLRCCPSPIPH